MSSTAIPAGRRVVVTGVGMITALGHNATDNWAALIAGRSGVRRISLFDASAYDSQVAGEVPEFDPTAYMDRKEARRADRLTQFAFVAADEALKQANYTVEPANGADMAVIVGTAIGGSGVQPQLVDAFQLPWSASSVIQKIEYAVTTAVTGTG